jgi:type II secretory pathway pseudopilin PulG
MRDALIVALIMAVCVLGYLLHSQKTVLTEQQQQIHDLEAKFEARATSARLDLQEKCSKQAREDYREDGWNKEPMASFTNHYNEKMNKCFVLIQNTDPAKPDDGTLFVTKTLFDAFEGTSYGEYMWRSDKSKKYWEVAPLHCMVTLLSGAEKACHSSDEFDAMVKPYMQ